MDSAILGVLIGSGLSLLGTFINQYFQAKKEQKQWENQQSADEVAWIRKEQKKETEYLREIYQHSLRSLSVFIAFEEKDNKEVDQLKKLELIDEVHKWVTMILLRHVNSDLDDALTSFTTWPEENDAKKLRNEIIKMSKREGVFFINEIYNKNDVVDLKSDPDVRTITLSIDDNFRKQQLIEGIELPRNYTFDFKLSEMSTSQREKLAEIYFHSNKSIPNKISLFIPFHQQGNIQISIQSRNWQAKLNPKTTKTSEILRTWEVDFEKNYLDAKKSLEEQIKNKKD